MSMAFPTSRRYEKGAGRRKHVGKGDKPEFVYDRREPKKCIGKCPSEKSMPDYLKTRLLNEAIPGPQAGRALEAPKTLYVVHEGAIYAAQTSDAGVSYHGYPYRGRLTGELIDRLEGMSVEKDCAREFRDWVKAHIIRHGEKR